jgi:hypothetical protein
MVELPNSGGGDLRREEHGSPVLAITMLDGLSPSQREHVGCGWLVHGGSTSPRPDLQCARCHKRNACDYVCGQCKQYGMCQRCHGELAGGADSTELTAIGLLNNTIAIHNHNRSSAALLDAGPVAGLRRQGGQGCF